MSRDKQSTYRATDSSHVQTAARDSKINMRANNRWSARMCDFCFQKATRLYKGSFYCADCAEREGINAK